MARPAATQLGYVFSVLCGFKLWSLLERQILFVLRIQVYLTYDLPEKSVLNDTGGMFEKW